MPRIDLKVPFQEKEQAKALGARWDRVKKIWYSPDGLDAMQFAKWHPTFQEWENVVDAKGRLTPKGKRLKQRQSQH